MGMYRDVSVFSDSINRRSDESLKGIVLSTECEFEVRDFSAPLHESVGEAVGGWIEIVHPVGLQEPYVMIVNEEGLIDGLPMNIIGSFLYGTFEHGSPIVGDVVFMKQGWTCDGPDIVRLTEEEIENLMAFLGQSGNAAIRKEKNT